MNIYTCVIWKIQCCFCSKYYAFVLCKGWRNKVMHEGNKTTQHYLCHCKRRDKWKSIKKMLSVFNVLRFLFTNRHVFSLTLSGLWLWKNLMHDKSSTAFGSFFFSKIAAAIFLLRKTTQKENKTRESEHEVQKSKAITQSPLGMAVGNYIVSSIANQAVTVCCRKGNTLPIQIES